MKFKEFMEMYDNLNGVTKVNDNNLNTIVNAKTVHIMDKNKKFAPFAPKSSIKDYDKLHDMEVVAFGFYNNKFCVRVK